MADRVITRIWHGMTAVDHADDYLAFLERTGVAEYKATPGNLSCQIWRRREKEVCHFWTVTTWESIEAIRRFAGDEYEKAKYYPEDSRYLLAFEPSVIHCETYSY